MSEKETIVIELTKLAEEHGGVLLPADVVEAARSQLSPLHKRFEWDDSEAAQKYRLYQARNLLLSISVEYSTANGKSTNVRAFVSLTSDRADGGYRTIEAVLKDRKQRIQLLEDAIEEMERFQRKYAVFKELAEVFSAMKRAKSRIVGKKAQKAAA